MYSLQVPRKCKMHKNHSKVFIRRKNLRIMICQAQLNPYKTLGVPSDAKNSDIRKAYKKLVLKYHPDVSDEINAETKFKEIQRAYEIIMGKDSNSWSVEEGGVNGWDFHDWYWTFSMKQRRAKKQGYVQPKVDLQTEEKKTQVRSQIAGLKQRAAHRRYKQQYQRTQSDEQSTIHEDQSQSTNNQAPKQQKTQHSFNNQYQNFEKREKNRNAFRGLGVLGVMITTSFQSFPNIKGRLIDARSTMCAEHKQLANQFLSNYFKPYFDAFALVLSGYGDMTIEEEFNQVIQERINYQKQPLPVNIYNNNNNNNTSNSFGDNSDNLQHSTSNDLYHSTNYQKQPQPINNYNNFHNHDNNNNTSNGYGDNLQHSTSDDLQHSANKLSNVAQQQYAQYKQSESESQYSYQYQQNNFSNNHHQSFKHDDGKVRSQLAGLKRKAQLKQNGM